MSNAVDKQIGTYSFHHICTLQPELKADGVPRLFHPHLVHIKRSELVLNAYGTGPFCKFSIPKNLHEAGVYALTIEAEMQYVGRCVDLYSQFNTGYGRITPSNCYKNGQPTNCRINNFVYQTVLSGKEVDLWFLATPQYREIKNELLTLLKPAWNRKEVDG